MPCNDFSRTRHPRATLPRRWQPWPMTRYRRSPTTIDPQCRTGSARAGSDRASPTSRPSRAGPRTSSCGWESTAGRWCCAVRPQHPTADERQHDAAGDRRAATLAGTDVPHPELIAGCDDLGVLGVVFYLMEAVDGFNPGNETDEAYVATPACATTSGCPMPPASPSWATVPGRAARLAAIKRPGSFLARQVPQFMRLLESYRHDDVRRRNPSRGARARANGWRRSRPADGEPGIMHGDAISTTCCCGGTARVGGVHRLGDVHGRRPAARPRVDAGVLARRSEHRSMPARSWPRSADWRREPNCWTPTLAPVDAARRGWTGTWRWRASSSRIVIEGTWSRYLAGQGSRDAGERLHTSAAERSSNWAPGWPRATIRSCDRQR